MKTESRNRHELCLEALERREMLDAAAQLVGEFNQTPPKDQSDNAWLDNELLFAAADDAGDIELWKSDGTPEGTVRVKDIRLGSQGSFPRDFAAASERVLFTAYTEGRGRELWSSDGTDTGTIRVRNLGSGAASSTVSSLTSVAGQVFFLDADQLWVSDGTQVGTRMVKNVAVTSLTAMGERLYFFVREDSTEQLWTSDGTREGTAMVKKLNSGWISDAVDVADRLYFVADDSSGHPRLWSSDGTSEGTSVVTKSVEPQKLVAADDVLYFESCLCNGYTPRSSLWRSDGTKEGTFRVKTLGANASFEYLTPVANKLFFTEGENLWQSDGTPEGTEPIPDIKNARYLRESNGALYLVGDSRGHDQEFWRTDGTEAGTQMLDVTPGTEESTSWVVSGKGGTTLFWSTSPESGGLWASTDRDTKLTQLSATISGPSSGSNNVTLLTQVDEKLFIRSDDRLWQTDGTQLTQIDAAPHLHYSQVSVLDDQLYFLAVGKTMDSTELWRTDGSNAGTTRLMSVNGSFLDPAQLTRSGDRLFFTATDREHGRELWMSDGTEFGTTMVKDIKAQSLSSNPSQLTDLNGKLLFSISNSGTSELWMADSLSGNTEIVAKMSGEVYDFVVADDQIYFQVAGENGSQLWRSNGSQEGTYYLTDGYTNSTTAVGDRLFFQKDGVVWTSDGTVAGTYSVEFIRPVVFGCGGIAEFSAFPDGTLLYSAGSIRGKQELWKSDGTAEGTSFIKEITADPIGSGDGVVYLSGNDELTGRELWRSDGTEEGTMRVFDLNPGFDSSMNKYSTGNAMELNGSVYFTADDGFHGKELWRVPIENDSLQVIGDANRDGHFDSSDLVGILAAGQFEDRIAGNSTWEAGDWNEDGDFTTDDLVYAFQSGGYEVAPTEARAEILASIFGDENKPYQRTEKLTMQTSIEESDPL